LAYDLTMVISISLTHCQPAEKSAKKKKKINKQ